MGKSTASARTDKRTHEAQGLLPFGFEVAHKPMELTAQAGLTLVAETLMALGAVPIATPMGPVIARIMGPGEDIEEV